MVYPQRKRQNPNKVKRQLEGALDDLKGFTPQVIAELIRRGEESSEIDGFGRGGLDSGPSSIGEHSDPTFSAVAARMDNTEIDAVAQAIDRMCEIIEEIAKLAREADRKRQNVIFAADGRRGRESSLQGECIVPSCGKSVSGVGSDRIKRGYCPTCYMRWTRWLLTNERSNDPASDRRRFELWVAERYADENSVEWRIEEINHLQGRGQLPTSSVK
jgi:hypothetical protein